MTPVLIVLNAGSSSLKFQVYDVLDGAEPRLVWKGLYEGLGESAHFLVKDTGGAVLDEMTWSSDDRFGHEEALMHLVSWLSQFREERKPVAIGHRVVHGGASFSSPVLVDEAVLQALEALVPLAPLHQPHNLEPIRIVRRRLPGMPQVAPPTDRRCRMPSCAESAGRGAPFPDVHSNTCHACSGCSSWRGHRSAPATPS